MVSSLATGQQDVHALTLQALPTANIHVRAGLEMADDLAEEAPLLQPSLPARQHLTAQWVKPLAYGLLNVASATAIVLANKLVMSTYRFRFTTALTLLHTLTTVLGMALFASLGLFTPKAVPKIQVMPLAGSYVGYVVLNNLSLRLNTISFYQVTKICIMPTLIAIELALFGKLPSRSVLLAVLLVLMGVALSSVSDSELGSNLAGIVVGCAAVFITALYQVWAGSKQKELQTGSMQLLHQYSPLAAGMLVVLIPFLEPLGLRPADRGPDTILGYPYSLASVAAIVVSSLLGLAVSLTTFLVIGSTSSLTYNIVGHLKTVTIVTAGCLLFGDPMPWRKAAGIGLAMTGIAYYSHQQLTTARRDVLVGKPVTPDVQAAQALQTPFK